MKIISFSTSEGKFLALFGISPGETGIFKQGDDTFVYYTNCKTPVEDLPEYDSVIGRFSTLSGADLFNKLGGIPIGVAAFLMEKDPVILKQKSR